MKIKNKLISLIASISLFITILPMSVLATSEIWADAGNYDTSWYDAADSSFVLNSPQQLAGLAVLVNGGNTFSDKTITLANNISLSGKNWKPIGGVSAVSGFEGFFDGSGYTISDMTVTTDSLTGYGQPYTGYTIYYKFAGLFGVINAAGIVIDVNINGTISFDLSTIERAAAYAGGIAGRNKGNITNCTNNVSINAENASTNNYAGGIAGYSSDTSRILGCTNTGDVSATCTGDSSYAGGICGMNDGPIINCANTGTASLDAPLGNSSRSGGISGMVYVNGTIENCYNTSTGSISANATGSGGGGQRASAGGIAGETVSSSSIKNSYSTAAVIIATAANAPSNVGGLVGRQVCSKEIKNSYWFHGGIITVGIGRLDYGTESTYKSCGYFSNNTGGLTKDTSNGTLIADNLLAALNLGLSSSYYGWKVVAGQNNGYPIYMQTYSVKYDANGGKGIVPSTTYDTLDHVVNVSFTPVPARAGCSFLGWSEDENATAAFYTQAGIKALDLSTNFTLFAIWFRLSYTVTNSLTNITSNGSASATNGTNYIATLTAGANYSLPSSIAVKVGTATLTAGSDYTYNASTGALSIAGDRIIGNIVITASANVNSYDITYNLNGGAQTGAPAGYTYGIGATLPTAPIKTGYTFGGWYDNANLTGTAVTTISTTATGDKEYWAMWTANNYDITYNLNDGAQTGAPAGYTYGIGATLPTAPIKTGYTFGGWYDNLNLTGTAVTTISTTATGDKEYWAMWTANNYDITYNLNDGAQTGAPAGYTYGIGATLPTAPIKTGYTFGGWYDNLNLTGTAVTTISTTATGDKEYWAMWTANNYDITYNLNDGTQSGAPASYTYGIGATLPTAPTKTGYTFGGWYDNLNLTGTAVTTISTTATGDKEYWAMWTANNYDITYNLNNGAQTGAPAGYTYGIGATLPTAPAKTGYTFGGWYDNLNLTGTAVTTISTTATGDKEYWAMWTANNYDITYNLNDGTQSGAPAGYTYGIGATLPTAPTKTGYTFGGWYDNLNLTGTAVTTISTTATGDKEYWAMWTANNYDITYNLNNGAQTGAPAGYTYGIGATLPTAPAKTGYAFGGWYDNANFTGTAVTTISTTATGDKEYWAMWNMVVIPDTDNIITGITEGLVFTQDDSITFVAIGGGMENTNPVNGDKRYIPASWNANSNGIWTTAPYTTTLKIDNTGSYTLTVTYREEEFNGTEWLATGENTVKTVNYTVKAKDDLIDSNPKTEDSTPVVPFAIILVATAIVLAFTGKKMILNSK